MKRILMILVTFLSIIQLQAQTIEIPPFRGGGDKILHFTASYTIAYTTYQYLQPRIGSRRARLYGSGISLGIGILKEVIDEHYRKGWEAGDLYANMGGILLFRLDIPISK